MNHRIMLLNRWANASNVRRNIRYPCTYQHSCRRPGELWNRCGKIENCAYLCVYTHVFLFRDIRGGVSEDLKIFQYPTKKLFLTETLTRHLHSQAGVLAKAPDNPSACRCSPRHDSSQPNCHWDLTCDMLHSHPLSKTRGRSKRRAPACWLP